MKTWACNEPMVAGDLCVRRRGHSIGAGLPGFHFGARDAMRRKRGRAEVVAQLLEYGVISPEEARDWPGRRR